MEFDALYDMIFKRKSVRRYDPALHLSQAELNDIEAQLGKLKPLVGDIKLSYRIVKREETTCKIGEYCLLIYSEQKPRYPENVGYVLEQLDLYLAAHDIGACWYGYGKTPQKADGDRPFAIMIAFGKSRPTDFRKDYTKAARKPLDVIWDGTLALDAAQDARMAPSAVNSQPWRVVARADELKVFRAARLTRLALGYFNQIDMGIYLCFLELALTHHGYRFTRTLPDAPAGGAMLPVADYRIAREDA